MYQHVSDVYVHSMTILLLYSALSVLNEVKTGDHNGSRTSLQIIRLIQYGALLGNNYLDDVTLNKKLILSLCLPCMGQIVTFTVPVQ